ncbi:nuclear transport factor 2 family protein [uncultured Aquimarina sp.]|uniref:nuclear transport factor 2 family protein n=1 Tax=uncultured Aquimarina sp. TaxID=575652 RepID=UPI002635CCFC|nr:nuclear transport factor 2 family protein [uncultured Aquimarina sp.]
MDKTPEFSLEEDQKSVQEILKILDDHSISTEDKMMVWVDDLIHMAPNHPLISDKPTLVAHIEKEREYGFADMKHEITEMHSYAEVVVMHGRVTGTFYPTNKEKHNAFSTKNMFVFRRMKDNSLKIWKVIFNMTS